jgi:hypothetical protein
MLRIVKTSTRPASGWLAGLVLGVASGFLLIELGVIGLAFLAVALVVISWKGPRLLAAGGLLTGSGVLWTVLFARVALTCGATAFFPDPNCSTDDLTPWVASSAAIFIAGLLLSAFALARMRR